MNTMNHDGAREIERAIHDGYDRWFDGNGTDEDYARYHAFQGYLDNFAIGNAGWESDDRYLDAVYGAEAWAQSEWKDYTP